MEKKQKKQIAWEIRYGLPTGKYLEFVHAIRQDAPTPLISDPFTIELTDLKGEFFVERSEVEGEISRPGNRIIMGPSGSGKTLLFDRLLSLTPENTLVVLFPINGLGALVPEADLLEGKNSILTAHILSRYIFDAYWKQFMLQASKRLTYYPLYRQYREWTRRLHWFYQQFRPYSAEIPNEFELTAWLNQPQEAIFKKNILPEDILREIVAWVTFKPERQEQFYNPPLGSAYDNISILIDGVDSLSTHGVTRLIRDTQKLSDPTIRPVSFKIFVNTTWQSLVESMDSVRKGMIGVYRLPAWREDELQQLLAIRWVSPGDFETGSVRELGEAMGEALTQVARRKFSNIIIKNALKCAGSEPDYLDAPIHALKLARGFVAACAGCWTDSGFAIPLDEDQLQQLATIYKDGWNEEE